MKASGVEWLGEVPATWSVVRLKYVTPQVTVGIVVTPAKYYVDEGVPCLRSLNVRPGRLLDTDLVHISEESNAQLSKSQVFAGDLVAVRTGKPGTTAVVDERFDRANCIDLLIIRQSDRFVSDLLSYTLNSDLAVRQFTTGSGGAIQQHFNVETAKDLIIPLPPVDEQVEIVQRLDSQVGDLDEIVKRERGLISRLQELRTSLISEVVTGKVDVRGEAVGPLAPEAAAEVAA
jgi:type I restriction enzyme S subunit